MIDFQAKFVASDKSKYKVKKIKGIQIDSKILDLAQLSCLYFLINEKHYMI